MENYWKTKYLTNIPRLPLQAHFDLTYRCNNKCRHCWSRIPANSPEKRSELDFDEIKNIVDSAREMGCQSWSISGGEPMLRQDFIEIFDYITRKSVSYSINTNGTLITPAIARLLKRRGRKIIALYGATAEVHDRITRTPGSFEATMQGFKYLIEAEANYIVQLIPMKDNFHQYNQMIKLAETLSKHWRCGAAWLYLTDCGDMERNREIVHQRLKPKDCLEIDRPDVFYEDTIEEELYQQNDHQSADDRLFASCILSRRDFHVDPYGQMSFCVFIKDPALRYDLRRGNFRECWDKFIPSLADRVRGGDEYQHNCGSCNLRYDCRWCPAYAYLEHRRFSAKIDYLCDIAQEKKAYKDNWLRSHRRYYQIGDIPIQVDSDIPISKDTFHQKLKMFEVHKPKGDLVRVHHSFFIPDIEASDFGEKVHEKLPWAIYQKENSWIYMNISDFHGNRRIHQVAIFNKDHTRAIIYNSSPYEKRFREGNMQSLTFFPSDQILLARVLADRQGCYIHAGGVIMNGNGLLFAGHSDAGKSTIITMLKEKSEILCDDRIIVRRLPKGYITYGTWSHGDVPDISSNSAPLRAILFLDKATENRLLRIDDKNEIIGRLLACLIKPLVTRDWWEKMLSLVEHMANEIPCYILRFDKSGKAIKLLMDLKLS